jgi:sugar/nucleoside kinase (ribokinase family)
MVFADLSGAPSPGRELRTTSLGISPGGIANIAVAAARLGLSVRLVTALGQDAHGDYLWNTLSAEGIDLAGTRRLPEWATPVTVSLVYHDDRCMITSERPPATGAVDRDDTARPAARAVFVTLDRAPATLAGRGRASGALVFADIGWDESEAWSEQDLAGLDSVDVFLPNCIEATSYTRTGSPEAAARRLVELVPTVVVKCGAGGAIAMRSADRELVHAPAIDVPLVDPTGAGDVFDAAFIVGTLARWQLEDAVRFANLCAGLSVAYHGGSLSAPTLGDVARWLAARPELSDSHAFLGSFVRGHLECAGPPRAQPTLRLSATGSDV